MATQNTTNGRTRLLGCYRERHHPCCYCHTFGKQQQGGANRLPPFENLEKLKSASCPILVIHGKLDNVIPFEHGQQLFEAAAKPKRSYWVERAGHNNLLRVAKMNYWKTLKGFSSMIDKVALMKSDVKN